MLRILVLTILSLQVSGQHKTFEEVHSRKVRKACIQSLKMIKEGFDPVIVQNPEYLGRLDAGKIDTNALLIRFPLKRDTTIKPLFKSTQGITVSFWLKENFPHRGEYNFQWMFSDLWLRWNWTWGNGSFPAKLQTKLFNTMKSSFHELDSLEEVAISNSLEAEGSGPFILIGRKGLSVELDDLQVDSTGLASVSIYERNRSWQSLSVYPPKYQVIVDGVPQFHRGIGILIRGHRPGVDPFFHLKPGDRIMTMKRVFLGKLSPGKHVVRVALCHAHDRWTDLGPTIVDGRPAVVEVEDSWMGVAVSEELSVSVEGEY